MSDVVRNEMGRGPMSRFQITAIGICVVLNMLDGFDVLVIAFASASVKAEWKLSGSQLGVLFSVGLAGMAAGSLLLAPWADRFGRRVIVLVSLSLCCGGMLISALARNLVELAILRVVTGIGIGGMLASLAVITAEYASDRWRRTAVSLQATGYAIGAAIGGLTAGELIEHYGWRSAFVFGALCTAAMFPVVIARLPESVDFLLDKRPPNALARLNVLLHRMERSPIDSLPPRPLAAGAREQPAEFAMKQLFAPACARSSLLIALAFFLHMFSFYFVVTWTPQLLSSAGWTTRQGINGGVLLNVGGTVGGLVFGYVAARFGLQRLIAISLVVGAGTLAAFGFFARDLSWAFPIAIAIGVFVFASMVGLYALTPMLFPASIRTTGMGWAIGVGRFGALLGPFTAGLFVDAGWASSTLYYLYALPMIAAAVAMGLIRVGAR